MKNFFKQKNKGFTLVEVLVAVVIFTLSILSVMAVLGSGVANTNFAKNKIIAEYLAQEGIEYIRNTRDTNVLYTVPGGWQAFLSQVFACDTINNSNGCQFDDSTIDTQPVVNIAFTPCDTSCRHLFYEASSGKYTLVNTAGVDSGFVRKIIIEGINPNNQLNNGNEIKVTSTVSWIQPSGPRSISFSENLFNWVE